MIVLLDAGNSNLKLALLDVNGDIERITIEHFQNVITSVKKLIYASVKNTPELEQILTSCQHHNIFCQQIRVSKTFKHLECGYIKVENLGIDRWLAVIAARTIYPNPNLLIVDAGTAITIDVCSGNKHLGGWITPGLTLMQDSIIAKAPGVFSGKSIANENFGTNTPSALFHGCIYSIVGMIEKAEKLVEESGDIKSVPLKIILTGGDAVIISQYLTLVSDVNEDLIFIGLKQFI